MVGVVTDSAANLPPGLAAEHGIVVVPLLLHLGEEVFRDGVDLSPADFYRRLERDREAASTAAPSAGAFLSAFEATGAEEVICVVVVGSMSGSATAARLAATRFGGRAEVVDSLSASMAEGFVALEAARLARAGGTLEEVRARAVDVATRTRLLATIDTFEFLERSGRVSRLQAYAATRLDIKPVFRFAGGQVAPAGRPRTRRRALDSLVDGSMELIGDRPVHLAGLHAAAEEEATAVVDRIARSARVVERHLVEVTPVIGAHVGPGLVGTAFYCE